MSSLYLARPEDQQKLEWYEGGILTMLLDGAATDGRLMMGRFDVARGEATPLHLHRNEDEIFLLISGSALLWYGEEEHEIGEGTVVFLPRDVGHAYRITSARADLLMINTPAGIEGMFREVGRDLSTPRPAGFAVTPDPEVAERYGNVVLGPPR